MMECRVSSIDPEQPEFGIPAEAVFAALLASALRNPRAAWRATPESAKATKAASTQ